MERILLVSATRRAPTLDDVVRCYQQGGGLSGAILTKLDEAMSAGSLDVIIIRHKLPLHYVTNGQRCRKTCICRTAVSARPLIPRPRRNIHPTPCVPRNIFLTAPIPIRGRISNAGGMNG